VDNTCTRTYSRRQRYDSSTRSEQRAVLLGRGRRTPSFEWPAGTGKPFCECAILGRDAEIAAVTGIVTFGARLVTVTRCGGGASHDSSPRWPSGQPRLFLAVLSRLRIDR
jgi:hypothetical protein